MGVVKKTFVEEVTREVVECDRCKRTNRDDPDPFHRTHMSMRTTLVGLGHDGSRGSCTGRIDLCESCWNEFGSWLKGGV